MKCEIKCPRVLKKSGCLDRIHVHDLSLNASVCFLFSSISLNACFDIILCYKHNQLTLFFNEVNYQGCIYLIKILKNKTSNIL